MPSETSDNSTTEWQPPGAHAEDVRAKINQVWDDRFV